MQARVKIRNAQHVAEWRLCVGCGACYYACPHKNIELVNFVNMGIRPVVQSQQCKSCSECLKVCPGYESSFPDSNGEDGYITVLRKEWGPILEIWEACASDPEIRYHGSSGGVVTALALYCLEREGMAGVLHTSSNPEHPWENKSMWSQDKRSLLSAAGSRYSPASPCDSLAQIEAAEKPCVFIGKPCDVRALRKAQVMRKNLDDNVGLAIGIFCAGTPSTQATLDLLRSENINIERISDIRYRGKGWPGMFSVTEKGENYPATSLSYRHAWGFLQAYRPYSCYLCPDSTSEFADIACGDPWYRDIQKDDKGFSLVLVRSEKGQKVLQRAAKAGYIKLNNVEPHILQASQKNLLRKRRSLWGRLFVMKMFGIPVPTLKGFPLFQNWMAATLPDKMRSILGTCKRIVLRKYTRPIHYEF